VVGGKLVLGGLYEKIGINVTRRSRGPNGGLFNSVEPFTEAQRKTVRGSLQRVYEQFTRRVRLGRGNRIDEIEQVAQGRLFTGRQAKQNGLVDETAGREQAIEALAAEVELDPGDYELLHLPAPMSLQEFLNSAFGAQARAGALGNLSGAVAAARQVLGPRGWDAAAPILEGLMQLRRERVLTLMPAAIVLR